MTKPTKDDHRRLLILSGGIFLLLTLLVGQFFRIQIVEGEKWSHHAGQQHYFDVIEPFVRGKFYSNTSVKKGHPEVMQKFAFDIRKFHLYIDPEAIPEKLKNEVAGKLFSLSHPQQLEAKKFRSQFDKETRSRKIVSWMDENTKENVMKWWLPYARKHKIPSNAVFVVGDTLRSHPFGKLLGQVLHTVRVQKDDKSQQAFPTGGLEHSLHKYLTGKQGKRRLMRSPRHSLETNQVVEPPEHGADCYLTINHYLQAICEEEVERGVKNSKARCGWAVMMDPHTGEILALAQYPFFFPDDYQRYFNNKELIEDSKVKAITDANEPGSIMKPVSLAIAFKANKLLRAQGKSPVFSVDEKMDTSSGRFPGRSRPITDTHFHHYLNTNLALQKSSNIYAATLIQRTLKAFGEPWYRNELQNTFGFGLKTGIELPSESPGVLPMPGKKHPNGKLEWSTPTPYSLAIGHNIQANSIQMARVFAIFANGGKLVQPTLVRKIIKNDEVLIDNTQPERSEQFPRVLDPDIVQAVVKALKFVTKKGGCASGANIWGYTEAGKTGTSMKIVNGSYSDKKHISTFVGFAPVSNPAFVLLVCMDEPLPVFIPGRGSNHHGGLCCAPVFREIGRRALEYLGTTPDDPHGYPKGDPRFDEKKADCISEAKKLEELYKQWNGSH
ncbi:MAG: pbp1 [Chlamydiia bacterium]|nr:pbp1 [Chlamydiia bacterium]